MRVHVEARVVVYIYMYLYIFGYHKDVWINSGLNFEK